MIPAAKVEKSEIVEIDPDLCTGCGACVSMCPARILYMDDESGMAKCSDQQSCDRLAGCMNICPSGAIRIK